MAAVIRYYDAYGNDRVYDTSLGNYRQVDPFTTLTSPFRGYAFPSSTTIWLTPREINFQPNTLGTSTHVYVSPEYNDIIALAQYFGDWQCAYQIKEGPAHSITVQIPWDTFANEDFTVSQYVGEQWEIVPNVGQKSLITNGLLANPFAPVSATGNYVVLPDVLKVGVQRAYENKSTTLTIPAGTPSSSSLALYIPYGQKILNYMRGGVEGVPSYTQTLKRTATIDTRNTNRAFQSVVDFERQSLNAQGTVNYIYSTSDMFAKYPITDTVHNLMMPSYTKQITVTGLEPTTYYAYAGWLVQQPQVNFITRNKVQLTQTFIWDEWLSGMYYIHSNPSSFPLVANPSSNPNGFDPTP